MKIHTTNYFNSFIQVAEDCPTEKGEMPAIKGEKRTVANLQFDMVYDKPYQYTSDEVLFGVYALRKGFSKGELAEERAAWFSKGQPCFRASPLTKRYGWGVHSNDKGQIAIYPMESKEYKQFAKDKSLTQAKAMRSKRAK